jgi:hypothetical protein
VCTVEIAAPPGQRISWADVLVLEAPGFARPLRSRVVARAENLPASWVRVALALVMDAPGRGVIRVRARAVLCSPAAGRERCVPATRDTELDISASR